MKTEHADSKGSGHAPHAHPPRGVSPLRLMILLSILAVVGGALLYDWVIAPPRVKAANEKLLSEVLLYNETGLRSGASKVEAKEAAATGKADGMLYTDDIQGILGMAPTKTETTEFYTIEHYCWWGWVPRKRNFITVLYIGDSKKRHYSTHYANMMPEDNVLPGKVKPGPVVDLSSEPNAGEVALPAAAGAPDEVKGRPATKVDAKASGENKKEETKKDESKKKEPKAEESNKETAKEAK